MKTRAWAVSDVGLRRDHNEDSFLSNEALGLYAVADGMGGHLGGERASRMAVEILEKEIEAVSESLTDGTAPGGPAEPGPPSGSARLGWEPRWEPGATPHPVAVALREATLKAAAAIHREAQLHPERTGMGTTLSAALFHGNQVTLCHVGDSRVYLLRKGVTKQLTEDHSWIQEQIRAGLITPEDSIVSRFRNIITRSVGFEPVVEPDLSTHEVEPGDCYLLCSDGLSNYLDEKEIGEVLAERPREEAGKAFVDLANERGGDDNITCIVIAVEGEKEAAVGGEPGAPKA